MYILSAVESCVSPMMDCSVRNMTKYASCFDWGFYYISTEITNTTGSVLLRHGSVLLRHGSAVNLKSTF